jgi:hypothetical protein
VKHRVLTFIAVLIALAPLISPLHAPAFAMPLAAQTQTPSTKPTTPAAKAWAPTKTPWGDPDLQGTYTSDDCIGTPMQRPANLGDRLVATEQELQQREGAIARNAEIDSQQTVTSNAIVTTGPPSHWVERARRPCRQTSLVIDPPNGQIPPLTPEAQTRAGRGQRGGGGDELAAPAAPRGAAPVAAPEGGRGGARGGAPQNIIYNSWEDFSYYIRCITRGVAGSILPVIYGNGTQIVQAPGYVMLLQEMIHEARVIPLDKRPHASSNIRSYMGDPRGHWEGNTLVVETTNFIGNKTGIGLNGGGTPTSDALKLTERFTKVDPNTINYELTIDDSKVYTKPWKVGFPVTLEQGYQNFEYACHEGNYAMFDSLSGARSLERAAEEAAAKKK